VVEASPGCPVERPGHDCRPRLLGDVQVVARPLPAGVTATTRTRADGRYALRLRPGRYVLVAVMRQVVPRCRTVPVSVTSPAPVSININCDSGIR
jgi:Carboxypeptidase regulatory-like domain